MSACAVNCCRRAFPLPSCVPELFVFRDQSGVVKFFGSFAFNRKRNVLELEIRQDYMSSGTQKYVVSSCNIYLMQV